MSKIDTTGKNYIGTVRVSSDFQRTQITDLRVSDGLHECEIIYNWIDGTSWVEVPVEVIPFDRAIYHVKTSDII